MGLKFNIDRPKVSDDEIKKKQNFDALVEKFKQQSLKKAQGDESWWKNKPDSNRVVRYSTIIAGATVICTITYFALFNKQTEKENTNDKITTQKTVQNKKPEVTKSTAFIQAPSSKLKTAAKTYTVNNAKGGKITHPSSTKISVPKNAFVDKTGKSIVGDITIEYKEFHDMGDVIVNGIPMAYDSAGKKYNLETAGMFDIRGYQNGEPVFIAPAKEIEVELASTNDEQRFNQYILDTIEKNWKYIQKDKAVKVSKPAAQPQRNDKLSVLQHEINTVIPRKIDSTKVVYAKKIESLPKPKTPAKPAAATPGRESFKLEGSYEEFPELSSFDNVLFEVGAENKNYTRELHEITWSDVKVSQGPAKGINYLLTLKHRNRTEKLIVYPVLNGEDLESAKKQYAAKFRDYENRLSKRQAEEQRLLKEMEAKQAAYLAEQKRKQEEYEKARADAKLLADRLAQEALNSEFSTVSTQVKATRLFRISNFGIFNSDCPRPTPNSRMVTPIFVLNEKEKPLQAHFVYLIDHSNKTVFGLDRNTGFKMSYDADKDYSICVFVKEQIYVCTKETFKSIVSSDGKKFKMNAVASAADNIADFKKALEI